MKLYLLRHGKTLANEQRLYCGSTDLPLSPLGRREMETARETCVWPQPEAFYTSGTRRTAETLKILYPGAAFAPCPGLREINFGDFEMKSYEALKEDPDYLAWISGDNEANVCPNGESGAQSLLRAAQAVAEILARDRDALAVTHGGIIAGLMAGWFPARGGNRYEWQPRPGRGYGVEFKGGQPRKYWEIPGEKAAASSRAF